MAMMATAPNDNDTREFFVARKATPSYVKGRRDFFKYRDLGVTAASNGVMRAQVTEGSAGMTGLPGGTTMFVTVNSFICSKAGSILPFRMTRQ